MRSFTLQFIAFLDRFRLLYTLPVIERKGNIIVYPKKAS
jgi:hypothetical protein